MHAIQGSEKLFKGKDFSCTGSFGLFSGETQETACQNRSLLLKLPSLESLGSQGGLRVEEGRGKGRAGSPHTVWVPNRKEEGGLGHMGKNKGIDEWLHVSPNASPLGHHAVATNVFKNSLIQFYKQESGFLCLSPDYIFRVSCST